MSKWNSFGLGLIGALIGGALMFGAGIFFVTNSEVYKSLTPNPYGAGAGHKMLLDFQCRYGETKHVLINGIDDDFAITGVEPSRKSGMYDDFPGHPVNYPYRRAYDETGNNKAFSDFFKMPPHIAQGLFVARLEQKEDYGNDYFVLGNLGLPLANGWFKGQHEFEIPLQDLSQDAGWEKQAGIYSARFKDILLQYKTNDTPDAPNASTSLWSYLQNKQGERIIDVLVGDDTAVDFTGMAICTMPSVKMGVTFSEILPIRKLSDEFIVMGCGVEISSKYCNPIYGDTSCAMELPLACIKDVGEPLPDLDKRKQNYLLERIGTHWSGSKLDFTPAIAGNYFKTIQEANQYCAVQFGEGWRVMDYHDGGFKAVAGRLNSQPPNDRVWLNIKDQPRATCWARDRGEP